jgi:hypothetical protein
MFQVTLARLEPLSPLTYWYLDEQEDDPIMALTMPIQAATRRQLFNQMTKISKRINGRCKGLLEVTPEVSEGNYNSRVDFLHRTVKDFLMTIDMQAMLKEYEDKSFNAELAICRALLAELKSTATMNSRDAPSIQRTLHCFFHAAQSLERNKGESPVAYLDMVERTVDEHVRSGPRRSPGYPWNDFGYPSFLEVAVNNDLQIFVRARQSAMAETVLLKKHNRDVNKRLNWSSPQRWWTRRNPKTKNDESP